MTVEQVRCGDKAEVNSADEQRNVHKSLVSIEGVVE